MTAGDLRDELAQLVKGAQDKLAGAEEIIGYEGCSSRAADLAYNGVGDAVNLLTKAVLRKQGRVITENETAPRLLRDAVRILDRAGLPLPAVTDLITIVLNRNGSVHEGAASVSEVEAVRAAIVAARLYATACATVVGPP
jgi:hypothetical protein